MPNEIRFSRLIRRRATVPCGTHDGEEVEKGLGILEESVEPGGVEIPELDTDDSCTVSVGVEIPTKVEGLGGLTST